MATLLVRLKLLAQGTLAVIIGIAVLGLAVDSLLPMPDNARVYIDPEKGTYFAPPCVSLTREQERVLGRALLQAVTWRDSMSAFVKASGLLPAVAREVRERKLRADPACRETGAFFQEQRSLTGRFFQEVGILSTPTPRWNADGSWNY